ncbi:MAG: SUMF1/EgtB/PvdO family nonheme iron enzyme, partial [Anaerolineales bacterium]|nr:SUMF1/EgtB/PvdO family nonheme iron enzyme [Anaerolineales bacterium]
TWLGVTGDLPLPIFITLSEYNRYRKRGQGSLVAYLSHSLIENNVVAGLPADFFTRLLLQGRACCLLLDGLDEVTNEGERWLVSEDVAALAANRGIPHLLVTSRSRAYEGRTTLPFRTATVQPMTPEAVDALAGRWCRAVYAAAEAEAEAADLQGQIRQLEAHRRARQQPPLVETPLLVTLVAIVHYDHHRLPQQRAELYQKCVDVLLAEKYRPGRETYLQLADWGGSEKEKRRLAAELAYRMMAAGSADSDAGRQADEKQIMTWLRPTARRLWGEGEVDRRLQTFLQALGERNSLLNERGGQYAFIHLTFQEYLCAYYLAEILRDVTEIARFFREAGRVNAPWWRETILLTVGYLYLGLDGAENALKLVQALVAATPDDSVETLAAAELAAAGFLELESQDGPTAARVRQSLKRHLSDARLPAPPLLRLLAGDALNGLGDDRPGVLSLEPDLVPIPAGAFLMGDQPYEATIREPFAIARYPVTNAQYRRFVADGGYTARRRDCWTDDGWRYRESNNWRQPRYWDDGRWNRENQPVVGVSWYEAVAFCRWLTARLRERGFLRAGQAARLPTEAEWERAARHTDGRAYPWGDWREGAANSKEAGLERTTAVGVFPIKAMSGILDMSGNVWEWCQTRWRDAAGKAYPPQPYRADDGREELAGDGDVWRVLRGGAYYSSASSLRCASRAGSSPDLRDVASGFRVCVSPFSTSDL